MRKIHYSIIGAVSLAAAALLIGAPAHGAAPKDGTAEIAAINGNARDRSPAAPVEPVQLPLPKSTVQPVPSPPEICLSRPVGEGMMGATVCWPPIHYR